MNGKYIGLQIKPASGVSHISQIFKERQLQEKTHKKFTEKYGGKVFIIFSVDDEIKNNDILKEIEAEIKRLKGLS